MFQIFKKKKFLVDYLEGMVDIHNHILPGIDDGAKDVGESIELIKAFSEIGIQKFIATPHIMHDYYPNTKDTIGEALIELNEALLSNNMTDISVSVAAEHMIDSNFETLLEIGETMPLSKYHLLVEMSYLQPSINFDHAIQKILSQGYYPILAHPERYLYFHKRLGTFKKFKAQGILFQLNILSLGDFYGTEVQKTAIKLLEEGLFDFIASDVHNEFQLNSIREIKVSNNILAHILPLINNTIEKFY